MATPGLIYGLKVLFTLLITAFQNHEARRQFEKARRESIAGEVSIRASESGTVLPIGYGLAHVRGIPVDAVATLNLEGDPTAYIGALVNNFRGNSVERDSQLAKKGVVDGRVGTFNFSGDDHAIMVSREALLANEFNRLVDVYLGDRPLNRNRKVGEAMMVKLATPGVPDPMAALVVNKQGGGQPWDIDDRAYKFTDTASATAIHVNRVIKPVFNPNEVPIKDYFGFLGEPPKVVRTGAGTAGDPYVYAIEKDASGTAKRGMWSRIWMRTRLDYVLSASQGRGYGGIGYNEDRINLRTAYEEQEYDSRLMRGIGAEDGDIFEDVVEEDRTRRYTHPMSIFLVAPQVPRPPQPDTYDPSADSFYAASDPAIVWKTAAPTPEEGSYWRDFGRIDESNKWTTSQDGIGFVHINPREQRDLISSIQGNAAGIEGGSPFIGQPGIVVLRHMFNGIIPSDWDAGKVRDVMLDAKPGAVEYIDRDGKLSWDSPKSHRKDADGNWVHATTDEMIEGEMRDPHIIAGSMRKMSPDSLTKLNMSTIGFGDVNLGFAESSRSYPVKGSQFAADLLALDGGVELPGKVDVDGIVDTYSALTAGRTRLFHSRRFLYTWTTDYAYINYHKGSKIRAYSDDGHVDGDPIYITRRRRNPENRGQILWEGFYYDPTDTDWQPTTTDDVATFRDELPDTAPPRDVRATYDETTENVRVTWLPPLGVQIEHYDIQHNIDGEGWVHIGQVPGADPLVVLHPVELGDHVHVFRVSAIGARRDRSEWVESGELRTIRSIIEKPLPLGGGCPPEVHTADIIGDDLGGNWQFLGDPYDAFSVSANRPDANRVATRPLTAAISTITALAAGRSNLSRRLEFTAGNLIPADYVEGGEAAYLRRVEVAEETGTVQVQLAGAADGAADLAGPQLTPDAIENLWLGLRMKGYRLGVNFAHTGQAGGLSPSRAPRMLLQTGQTFAYAAANKGFTRAYGAAQRPGMVFDRTGGGTPKTRSVVSIGYSRDTGKFTLDLAGVDANQEDTPMTDIDGFRANLGPNLEATLVIVFRKGGSYLVTHMGDDDSTEPYTWDAADKAAADAFFAGNANLQVDYAIMDDHRWRQEFGDGTTYASAVPFGDGDKVKRFQRNLVGFNLIHRATPVRGPLHLFGADYLGFLGIYLRGGTNTITAVIETTASSASRGEPAQGNIFEAGHDPANYRLVILMFGQPLILPFGDPTSPGQWTVDVKASADLLRSWIAVGDRAPQASVMVVDATLWDEASIRILSRIEDVHTSIQLAMPLKALSDSVEPYSGIPTEGYLVKYAAKNRPTTQHWRGATPDGVSVWARHLDFDGTMTADYRAVLVDATERFGNNPLCWWTVTGDPNQPREVFGGLVDGCPPRDIVGFLGLLYTDLDTLEQFRFERDPWDAADPAGVEDLQTDVPFTINTNTFELSGPGQVRGVFVFDVKFSGIADRRRPTKIRFKVWDPNVDEGLTDPDIAIGFRDALGEYGSQRARALTRSAFDPATGAYTYEGDITDGSMQSFLDNLMQVFPAVVFNNKDATRWRVRGTQINLPAAWSASPNNPTSFGQVMVYADGRIAFIVRGGTGELTPGFEQNLRMVLRRERDGAILSVPGPDAAVNETRDADGNGAYVYTPDAATKALVSAYYASGLVNDTVDILFYNDAAESPLDICLALASKRCAANVAGPWVQNAKGRTSAIVMSDDFVYVRTAAIPVPIPAGGNDSETHTPAGTSRIRPPFMAGQTTYRSKRTRTYLRAGSILTFEVASNWGAWGVAPAIDGVQVTIITPVSLAAGAMGNIRVSVNVDAVNDTEITIAASQGTLASSRATIPAGASTISFGYTAPNIFGATTTTITVLASRQGSGVVQTATFTVESAPQATLDVALSKASTGILTATITGTQTGIIGYNWTDGRGVTGSNSGRDGSNPSRLVPRDSRWPTEGLASIVATRGDLAALATIVSDNQAILPRVSGGGSYDPAILDFELSTPNHIVPLPTSTEGSLTINAATGSGALNATALVSGVDLSTAISDPTDYAGSHPFTMDGARENANVTLRTASRLNGRTKSLNFIRGVPAAGLNGEIATQSHVDNSRGSVSMDVVITDLPDGTPGMEVIFPGLSAGLAGVGGIINRFVCDVAGSVATAAVRGNQWRLDNRNFSSPVVGDKKVAAYAFTGTEIKRLGGAVVEALGAGGFYCTMNTPRTTRFSMTSGATTTLNAELNAIGTSIWTASHGQVTQPASATARPTTTFTAPVVTELTIVRIRCTATKTDGGDVAWAEHLAVVSP